MNQVSYFGRLEILINSLLEIKDKSQCYWNNVDCDGQFQLSEPVFFLFSSESVKVDLLEPNKGVTMRVRQENTNIPLSVVPLGQRVYMSIEFVPGKDEGRLEIIWLRVIVAPGKVV